MIYGKNGSPLSACFSTPGQSLASAYDTPGELIFSAAPAPVVPLKVATYNVGQWYIGGGDNVPAAKDADYYALQNGMIEQIDPDILCLQEYWKVFSKTGRTALSMLQQHFPYIREEGGNSGYFGRCICSKYPISDYTVRPFTVEASRYFDSCTITVGDTPITVVNTHLGLTQANRDSEITQLLQFLSTQTRFILCGDFNTAIDSTTANVNSADYIANVEPFIDAGYRSANFASFGFHVTYVGAENNELYLDDIYTSQNITIDAVSVDTTKRTDLLTDTIDHMPLIAELSISST